MSAYETRAWTQHYGDWTPAEVEIGNETLVDVYQRNLSENGDRPATYFFGRTLTYTELDQQVRAAAAGLKAFGIRPGDRVAIVLPNCPQHIVAFHAVLHLGATVVEHNPLYTSYELEGLFSDHGARVAIAWDKAAATLEPLRSTTDLETIISVDMTEAMPRLQQLALKLPVPPIKAKREQLTVPAPGSVPWSTLLSSAIGGDGRNLTPADIRPADPALILYTSGTTGAPKGAVLTHRNLQSNCLMAIAWVPNLGEEPERFLAALPLFHAYGMTAVCTMSIFVGAEIILLPAPKMDLILGVVKKHMPTWFPGVPTLYEKLADAAKDKGVSLKGIKKSFSGAATLPVATVEKWEATTGGMLVEGYGLTETSPVICGNPMNEHRRPGYIGLPFPNTEARVADPDDPSVTLPDGEEGELLVRGPQVFSGYLNNPEATEKSFYKDWFRTGDMAVMEEDGFIRLVARIKEVVITGGFNVYPAEVEETILSHPDVTDVAVVGRPRKDGSEDVVACVTLRDGAALDPQGMQDFARQRLARYKVPRTFYHFEELARDQMGKIRRREVQAELLELIQA